MHFQMVYAWHGWSWHNACAMRCLKLCYPAGTHKKCKQTFLYLKIILLPLNRYKDTICQMKSQEQEPADTRLSRQAEQPSSMDLCTHEKIIYHCNTCKNEICTHGTKRKFCFSCFGSHVYRCVHSKEGVCKECSKSSKCHHGRSRYQCRDCGGAGVCVHGRLKYRCRLCDGKSICVHQKVRWTCDLCAFTGNCKHRIKKMLCDKCKPSLIGLERSKRYPIASLITATDQLNQGTVFSSSLQQQPKNTFFLPRLGLVPLNQCLRIQLGQDRSLHGPIRLPMPLFLKRQQRQATLTWQHHM